MEEKPCESCRYKNGERCGVDNEPLERIDCTNCFNYEKRKKIPLLSKSVAEVWYQENGIYYQYGTYAYEIDAETVVKHLKKNGFENAYYLIKEITYKAGAPFPDCPTYERRIIPNKKG